jgi:hypothetical protein
MVEHIGEDLSGSRFERVNLSGSRFRSVDMTGVVMRGVELVDIEISGYARNVRINGVEVMGLVQAELDRRYPDRVRMRPSNPAGFVEAWSLVERLWAGTVERARALDPALLHESVDEEWSFIQTLRHLVFATDSWVRRAILGDPAPWHPLGLPFDDLPESPVVPRDPDARPGLDEVLVLRHERMADVRRVIEGLTDESLAAFTTPVDAPGWPPPRAYSVKQCLSVLLNEEWEHRLYAERDLAALSERVQGRRGVLD